MLNSPWFQPFQIKLVIDTSELAPELRFFLPVYLEAVFESPLVYPAPEMCSPGWVE